jgi:hypothetical protein
MNVSNQLYVPAALPQMKEPRIPCYKGLNGPTNRYEDMKKEKYLGHAGDRFSIH